MGSIQHHPNQASYTWFIEIVLFLLEWCIHQWSNVHSCVKYQWQLCAACRVTPTDLRPPLGYTADGPFPFNSASLLLLPIASALRISPFYQSEVVHHRAELIFPRKPDPISFPHVTTPLLCHLLYTDTDLRRQRQMDGGTKEDRWLDILPLCLCLKHIPEDRFFNVLSCLSFGQWALEIFFPHVYFWMKLSAFLERKERRKGRDGEERKHLCDSGKQENILFCCLIHVDGARLSEAGFWPVGTLAYHGHIEVRSN